MKNSLKLLLYFIFIITLYTFIANPDFNTIIYAITLIFFFLYGVYRKELNIAHISVFIITLYAFEYTTLDYLYAYAKTLFESSLITANLHFSFQLICTFLSFTIFIFRVQISRLISNSKNIKLTPFDNIITFIYLYTGAVILLAISEQTLYSKFNINSLSFIYDYFEFLIYIGMSAILTTLASMVICHEKDLKTHM